MSTLEHIRVCCLCVVVYRSSNLTHLGFATCLWSCITVIFDTLNCLSLPFRLSFSQVSKFFGAADSDGSGNLSIVEFFQVRPRI